MATQRDTIEIAETEAFKIERIKNREHLSRWSQFVITIKQPKTRKKRFWIGHNGERLSESSCIDRLKEAEPVLAGKIYPYLASAAVSAYEADVACYCG